MDATRHLFDTALDAWFAYEMDGHDRATALAQLRLAIVDVLDADELELDELVEELLEAGLERPDIDEVIETLDDDLDDDLAGLVEVDSSPDVPDDDDLDEAEIGELLD